MRKKSAKSRRFRCSPLLRPSNSAAETEVLHPCCTQPLAEELDIPRVARPGAECARFGRNACPRQGRPKLGIDLEEVVRKFALQLCTQFRDEIEREPRVFKTRAVRLLKSGLPPSPGRPCVESVTRAAKMREQGKPWREIYKACIPDLPQRDSDGRAVAQSRLRSAVRSRRNARQRSNSRA